MDALKEYEVVESDNFTKTDPISKMTVATIANCIEVIWELPSAEPERKKGELKTVGFLTCQCSECGAQFHELEYASFCPNCGTRMEIRKNE